MLDHLAQRIVSIPQTAGFDPRQPTGSNPAVLVCNISRKEKPMANSVNGSVLVVGGGISGMQAALDLANSGYYVYLLEKSPAIGGVMSQLDKTFPTNDCAM
jgi:heterodisulfide reductase subunit A